MTLILVLSVLGIGAILAELVLPGGLLGALGAILLIAAVVITFLEFGATAGIIATVILLIIGFSTLGWWMKFFHKLPVTRKLILEDASGSDPKREDREQIVGQTGVTLTDLTPSGHARIGDRKLDVMTEAASIPRGTTVEVVAMRGPSIIVRPLDEEA